MISAELSAAQQTLVHRRHIHHDVSNKPPKPTWLSAAVDRLSTPNSKAEQHTKSDARTSLDISIAPDIALAILRKELAASGRIWHLLRTLDTLGRGTISVAEARRFLCDKNSQYRCVGWRQLRNLLNAGNGIFWQRDKTHVWLRSRVKVAAALGVARIRARLVAVPIEHFIDRIGRYKSFLYATFHAGRIERPISRATLTDVSGVSASSQRNYEMTADVAAKSQFALSSQCSRTNYWVHGGHSFEIIDHRGIVGQKQQAAQIHQLPNCYHSHLSTITTNRKKRLNRNLKDLLAKGAVGNEQNSDTSLHFQRLYGIDNQDGRTVSMLTYVRSGQHRIWHAIEGC